MPACIAEVTPNRLINTAAMAMYLSLTSRSGKISIPYAEMHGDGKDHRHDRSGAPIKMLKCTDSKTVEKRLRYK